MTQVDFMFFLRLWVWSIQALPNPVRCFPNSGILFLITQNIYRKANKIILNLRNHLFSLILNLPIDSSPWFSRKSNKFHKKKFSKFFVSNQISGEGYICILWVLYGIISSIKTPQSYLFMIQVDFMLFLRLWVR